MLIQYEPTLWQYHKEWDTNEMIQEYGRWMRDNWNHPCVFMWDSNNETVSPELAKIINAVRPLDLSGRAWDNSWSPPAGPNDPVEVHPYLLRRRLRSSTAQQFQRDRPAARGTGEPGRRATATSSTNTAGCGCIPTGLPSTLPRASTSTAVPNGTAQDRQEFRWYVTGGPDGDVAGPALCDRRALLRIPWLVPAAQVAGPLRLSAPSPMSRA